MVTGGFPVPSIFGPYSPIRQAGSFYYVSGQVGVDPATGQCGRTIEEQTSQVMTNIKTVLSSAGLSMDHVVKTTIYVKDMANFTRVNDVYAGFFETPRPARGTVGVKDLPHVGGKTEIMVEIEAIAYKDPE